MKIASLAFAAWFLTTWFLGACAPVQTVPAPPAAALPRNQEMFGLVQALESNAGNVRSDACGANDHACVLSVLAQQKMEVATVAVMGLRTANLTAKVLAEKSRVSAGDIIRFRTPPAGQDRIPEILDIGVRGADRKPGHCDWEGGSPASYSGGVVCKGWSYKILKL